MSGLEKENIVEKVINFTPYGTDPEKDKMVKSDDWEDRLEMAEEGYGLDVLINDEDWEVRTIVAKQGYGLDILVNDESWIVRRAVAEQGYGLNILINDEDWYVRETVNNYLTSHNLTLEQWKSNQEHSKTNIINQAKNAIIDGKIDIKNVANNIRSTDNILNTNINKIDEINEISESNNINK